MKVIVCKDYDAMSKKAYEYMKECITSKKNAVLGLATGSTPVGLYKEMVADYKLVIQIIKILFLITWMNM